MRIVPLQNRTLDVGDRRERLEIAGTPFYLPVGAKQKSRQHAVVRCDCGRVVVMDLNNIISGSIVSCGCYRRQVHSAGCRERFTTHGQSYSGLYAVWQSMRARCENQKHRFFYRYGARGISVCQEWADFANFQQWAQASGYQSGLSIDRKDNDGGYSPENCQWITRSENTAKMHRDKENATCA